MTFARRLLFCLLFASICSLNFFGPRHTAAQTIRALLIAVPECKNPSIGKLPSTVNDVKNLARTLRERNENVEVRTLGIDDEKAEEKSERDLIGNTINKWLVGKSQKDDTIILYFSGHGFVDPKNPAKTYLVSSDCDPIDPKTGVPIDRLRSMLEKSLARNKFLIVDSCHSGANAFAPELDPATHFADNVGVITLASAKFSEKSLVWDRMGMSLFSYWLNEGLKGHADEDKNTFISVDELYSFIFRNVVRCNKISRKETQTPVRIIGADVVGIPNLVQLKSTKLEILLDDITEQIASQMELHRINRTGLLDFTIESQGGLAWTNEQYELIKLYAAAEIEQRLKNSLKKDSYKIFGSYATKDAITKSINSVNGVNEQKIAEPSLEIAGEKIEALLSGNVLGRQVHRFMMQCRLSDPLSGEPIMLAGGIAELTPDDWAMLGRSVSLVPQIQKEMNAGASRNAVVMSAKSVSTFLNVPENSPQRTIEALDALSLGPHPLAEEGFPFRVEIRVKKPKGDNAEAGTADPYTEVRTPTLINNQLYFPLEKGEIYQIRISTQGKPFGAINSVGVKVLVDGLNTFPEEERYEEEDSITIRYNQAKRVSLEKATAWSLSLDKPLGISGFYTRPTSKRNSAKYNEFQVTGLEDSQAVKSGETDMKKIGLISLEFLLDKSIKGNVVRGNNSGLPITEDVYATLEYSEANINDSDRVGTKFGEQVASEMEIRPCGDPGTMFAVLHLRYDTKTNIERLQKQFSKENH